MKKLLILTLCLITLLSLTSCGSKDKEDTSNAPLSGLQTASADKEKEETPDTPSAEEDIQDEESEEEQTEDTDSDRTEESDRAEIESNLRDARELIEEGYFEDATMIIDGLKTRDLTDDEEEELLELQKMMITISD